MKIRVCIILFDGVDDGNLFGSSLVFSAGNNIRTGNNIRNGTEFEITLVSVDGYKIVTDSGVQVTTKHNISDKPNFEIAVIPAGPGVEKICNNKQLLSWLKNLSSENGIIISLCRGAKLVNRILPTSDMEFTAHPDTIDLMSDAVPNGKIVSNIVYKDNGSVIAACGLVGPKGLSLLTWLHEK